MSIRKVLINCLLISAFPTSSVNVISSGTSNLVKTSISSNNGDKPLVRNRFQGLKKPDNWENFWHDVCIVNGFEPDWFNETSKQENINRFRKFYNISDEDFENRYATITTNGPKTENEVLKESWVLEWENLANYEVEWQTLRLKNTKHAESEWFVDLSIKTSTKFKFIFNSIKVELLLSGGYKQTTTIETEIEAPSQKLPVKANSLGRLTWNLWANQTSLSGAASYDMNWNRFQNIDMVFNDGHAIPVNVGWTLYAIAEEGTEPFFRKDSKDLFYWNENDGNESMQFTIPLHWQTEGLRSKHIFENLPLK